MEVTGKLIVKKDTQKFGAKEFKKRECVVETTEQYPQPIQIEFVQDKCELLDKFNIGDDVKISINLRGRKWESPDKGDVYFNSIQGWRIGKAEISNIPEAEQFATTTDVNDNEPDDLPF